MKMKTISHGCGTLALLTHSPSFTLLHTRKLAQYTTSMGFLALWLLAGCGEWEPQAAGYLERIEVSVFSCSCLPARSL